MVKPVPALLVGVMAAVIVATSTMSATARTFVTSENTLRSTWSRLTFAGGGITTTCDLTMEGSFHTRTIAKLVNSLIGYVTHAGIANCQNGTTVLS